MAENTTLEQNKALVRQQFERVVNHQEFEVADATIAPHYIDHSAPPARARGPESMKAFVRLQRAAYPDAHVTVEDIMAEGDRVAVRIAMRGTRARDSVQHLYRGTVWWRIADGKIVERWGAAFRREELAGE